MFAVFEAKGFQYCGSPGDKVKVPYLNNKVGEKVSFEKVLLVRNGDIKIGQPYIEGASIKAEIVEQGRYSKILVFKFKRRKRYKRTRGHRQTYTEIEIKNIVLGEKVTSKKKDEKEKVKEEKKETTKSTTKKTVGKTKTSKPKAKKTTAKKPTKKTTVKKKSVKSSDKTKKKSGTAKKTVKKAAKKTTKKTTKKTAGKKTTKAKGSTKKK